MSRTYRRKNSNVPNWVTSRIVCNNRSYYYEPLEGKERERSISLFYSDKNYSSKPWVSRRVLEHRQRIRDKKELDNINKKGYYEEYVFIPLLKRLKGWY